MGRRFEKERGWKRCGPRQTHNLLHRMHTFNKINSALFGLGSLSQTGRKARPEEKRIWLTIITRETTHPRKVNMEMEATVPVVVAAASSPAGPPPRPPRSPVGGKAHRRPLDLRDMLDELPSLSALKDKKWMKMLPTFPGKAPRRSSPSASPTASATGSDTMELSPVWLPTPKVRLLVAKACSVSGESTDAVPAAMTVGHGHVGARTEQRRRDPDLAGPALLHRGL